MGVTRFIKKLIFGAPPPSKFLTPDGAPKEPAKPVPASIPKDTVSTLPPVPPPTPGKPYKVAYVVTKSNFGGAQRYVYDLATHMPPDADAVVICGKGQGYGIEEELLVAKLTEAGVRTVQLRELTRDIGVTDFAALYKLRKVIRDENPCVLHLNSSKAGALGALAGRLAGVPKILFTAHGWPFNESRGFLWRAFAWFASVLTILLSSKVICVSTYDRNQFRGWFFSKKLLGIRNALPPANYMEREEARKNLVPHAELYENDIWVGTIAELNANKNISLALKAVAKAVQAGCNIFYAVAGSGEDRFALEDEMKALKLDQNVKFLGFVSGAPLLYKAFDIALLPSRKEGLPYAILAAQQAQVPIIASAVGGIPEVVHDGDNGLLFQSENLEQLTAALIRLCKDQELRVQFSKITPPEHFETMLRETFAQYR
jgi:glycosyltransferase involved in cell wall biosynthesis